MNIININPNPMNKGTYYRVPATQLEKTLLDVFKNCGYKWIESITKQTYLIDDSTINAIVKNWDNDCPVFSVDHEKKNIFLTSELLLKVNDDFPEIFSYEQLLKDVDKVTTISTQQFKRIEYLWKSMLETTVSKLEPKLHAAYEILKEKGNVYDLKLDRMTNLKNNLFDDGSIYFGIVDPEVFTHNKKAIYLHAENAKWIIQLIEEPFEDSWLNCYEKGIRIFRVYSPVDLDCIENSWQVNTTEKWVTKLGLTEEIFTDVTKYSQVIPGHDGESDYIVCERPTIDRIVHDHNAKVNMTYEKGGPVFCSSGRNYFSDYSHIHAAFFSLVVMCARLEIPGAEI